jgi:hypothetical protein
MDLDATADFIQEKRDFIPAALKPDMGGSAKQQKVILQIKAGQTAATAFPVQFVQLGSAKWTWKAQAVNWPQPASDASALRTARALMRWKSSWRHREQDKGNDQEAKSV